MTVEATDRVLLLSAASEARQLALQASEGIVVCVLEGDAVYETRKALRDLPNVMVVPADPAGLLPWQEEFFTIVYAPSAEEASPEMLRVLAPGGRAIGRWGDLQRPPASGPPTH